MNPIEGLEFDVPVEEKFNRQDKRLGLPAGTTKAQLTVESDMKADAVSKAGAEGWAQVMPKTRATLEKRVGRPLDPTNLDDALLMHGEVMRENLAKFKTPAAAMKAYNGGWSPEKWNNPETAAYVPKIEAQRAKNQKAAPIDGLVFEPSPSVAPISIAQDEPAKIAIAPEVKPKVGGVGQLIAGVGRGLGDAVDGGAYLLDKGLRGVGVNTTAINDGANALLAKVLPTALANKLVAPGSVSDINKASEAAYKEKVGDSGLATAGRIGGNIGSVFIPGTGQARALQLAGNLWKAPGIASKAGSIGVASGLGAAQGSVLNTKTDQDNALANALGGAAAGVVGQAALPLIKAGAKGAGALFDPFTPGGIDRITARAINQFKTGPIDPKFTSNVPGFKPTLAQATQDPGLAQLTRAIQSASPNAAAVLSQRAQGNNSALIDAIRGVAGDDAVKAATETARRQATAPLYAAVEKSAGEVDTKRLLAALDSVIQKNAGVRDGLVNPLAKVRNSLFEAKPLESRISGPFDAVQTLARSPGVMSNHDHDLLIQAAQLGRKLKNGTATESEAMSKMLDVAPKGQKATKVLAPFVEAVGGAEKGLITSPAKLQNLSKGILDAINEKGASGAPVNVAALKELGKARSILDSSIGRASPEYKAAQKLFAELSKPINSQLIAEQMLKKATSGSVDPVTGNPVLYADKFSNLLKNGDGLVKGATGRKTLGGLEGNVTPEAMQQFNAVKQALDLVAGAEKAGAITGSRTAQIGAGQNLLSQTLGPLGLGSMAGAPQIGLVSRMLNFAAKSQDPIIHNRLSEVLLDPALLAQLPKQRTGSPLLNNAMQRAISGGGAIAGGSAFQQ